ncbi:MAG: stalk domain-containing protein [Defluviitaleaceae bacterium]|nr:stalk domain-containing protein [Defluviitaleaceae bacterium]
MKKKISTKKIAEGASKMKKIFLLFFFAILFSKNIFANEIQVFIFGEAVVFEDQGPMIVDGRTLVPIRAVFEQLDFEIHWHEPTQTAHLQRSDVFIEITVGSDVFYVISAPQKLEVAAQIINGRTMLPLRALIESVGYSVEWDAGKISVGFFDSLPARRLFSSEISAWVRNYSATDEAFEFEREVIRLTNLERAAENISPLEECPLLTNAARFKAQSMHDLDYFSHTSPIYGRFENISRDVFGNASRRLAENLAMGHRSADSVVAGWMDSELHRKNILNPDYTKIGVGFFDKRWAQKFSD